MDKTEKTTYLSDRVSFRSVDRLLHNLHTNRSGSAKIRVILVSFIAYTAVMLLLGTRLQVSANYFIVIPLISMATAFGFRGGIVAGFLGLPMNLLMFRLIGHPEYSPDNKLIAELTGIIMGSVLGYLSDYYQAIEYEIEKRRIAEEKLKLAVDEKEILMQEIHHRVKNNLNIIKSLIQLQINRSKNDEFTTEAEKLIRRIYSIARVHEQLYSGNKKTAPALGEYIPKLVSDILNGIEQGDLNVEYHVDIPETILDIEQATSIGLIVNEVLTNAVKYSLILVEKPKIRVVLRTEEEKTVIELVNNAPTFIPEGDDYRGLGLKLIRALSGQLDAEYEYLPGNGTTFRLSLVL